MSEDDPLVAIVPKPEAERAIDALRAEGVYDDARQIREAGDDALALPVTRPPETPVCEVTRQADPEPRSPGLLDRLRELGWDDADLAGAPRSWAVVGSVILADFEDCPREREGEIGDALLGLHGGADTVLAREGIEGEHREPSVRTVAGAGDTETVHTEHGTKYALDLARVMFSPGNKAERARMGEVVEEGERVLDMFAGIGYFTLPMARAGARVTAIERNPTAFRYLLENSVLNGVQDRVDAYRADCRDVAIEGVDRVVMGCFDAVDYLDRALDALASDGILHVHAAVDESALWETPVDAIEAAAAGRDRSIEVLDRRVVKGCGEGFEHVVVDVRVA